MNSKRIGNVTEVKCMLAFMELGFPVLTPYGDCEKYDFIVDINGKFYRMQSKTASSEDNGASFKFSCRSSHRKEGHVINEKYSAEDIDYFITYYGNQCYLIPVKECGTDKRLRLQPTKNGQIRGITWAKDYELEEVIQFL